MAWDCSWGGRVGCGGVQSGSVLGLICNLLGTWHVWDCSAVRLFLVYGAYPVGVC